ncbi:phenylacetaldoxime dehydratase family protein [Sulfuritalea sp.]|uniref:phenylacetaldoxime dehydratase family protein n=1 Tax=Sulfuritalea sp. TaxID=2480090 RepID=UPI00286EB008|nr:phenylacetaldoxime dehydratase family protein [Sulfuritalea sp.]
MESAIPAHLRTARTRHRRVPDDYAPPYPSFVARHKPSTKRTVMAYFGLQFRGEPTGAVASALAQLDAAFEQGSVPGHWDRARYIDQAGFANVISIAYWDSAERFDNWFAASGAAWTADLHAGSGVGRFSEVLRPAVERYETLFSAPDRAEGVAVLAEGMSDVVQEHAYWGGARDRIPLSQTDDLAPQGAASIERVGSRLRIKPQHNLCLIRSGQDWSDTDAEERRMYLEDVEPVLCRGMDFLRDEGLAIGCYSNRYMTVLDRHGKQIEKSFGMSWWKSLAALERWAESHPTHVAIFGAAMQYLSKLGPAARLKLYHEVTVAAADEQFFEYLDCHDRTGMLSAG